jgi:hypothetical protein
MVYVQKCYALANRAFCTNRPQLASSNRNVDDLRNNLKKMGNQIASLRGQNAQTTSRHRKQRANHETKT